MDKFDLVRFTDNGFELDVRADSENETVWLTQEDMTMLFDRSVSIISRHIYNIFAENELDKNSNVRFSQRSNQKGKTTKKLLFITLMSLYQ